MSVWKIYRLIRSLETREPSSLFLQIYLGILLLRLFVGWLYFPDTLIGVCLFQEIPPLCLSEKHLLSPGIVVAPFSSIFAGTLIIIPVSRLVAYINSPSFFASISMLDSAGIWEW